MGSECGQRGAVVATHEAGIARNIGGDDGCQSTLVPCHPLLSPPAKVLADYRPGISCPQMGHGCPLWVESGRSPMSAIGQKRTFEVRRWLVSLGRYAMKGEARSLSPCCLGPREFRYA